MAIKVSLLLFFCNGLITTAKKRNYVKLEENEFRIPYFLVEKPDGLFDLEDLVNSKIEARARRNDITYYLFTQSNTEDGITLFRADSNLPPSIFDPTKEMLVMIHGWNNDLTSPVNSRIKSAVLEIFDLNLIVVDWSPIAKMNYVTAKNAVPRIGRYVGSFIKSLTSTYNIPLWRVSMVGHSLGAHIAGAAGTALNAEIAQIVGLDPAGPLVSVSDKNYCLDPSDAKFVQVIHTNGGLLGLSSSIGHTDYFPNGGKKQPGCGFDITGSCAHGRSYEYYAESILQNKFISKECSSYDEFSSGKCKGELSAMGDMTYIKGKITGDFYLDTNERSPFAKDT
ncbi:hypothetical protein NQ318_013534 [Aromia moschata]|uniref:Lipase domain-containing protein n=1 Tax=Aromia moschata TaxID=1265417 RepID=A0AAV8Y1A4_9CUCU|nr:hypothetical protein NQ318_013534 [Aromia moschata]